jgi:hypothetical protein
MAAVCFGPAVLLLIAPSVVFAIYGIALDVSGAFMARLLGASLLPLALFLFQASKHAADAWGRLGLWAGLLHNATLVLILVAASLSNTILWTGWPAAALHLLLVLGCVVALTRLSS